MRTPIRRRLRASWSEAVLKGPVLKADLFVIFSVVITLGGQTLGQTTSKPPTSLIDQGQSFQTTSSLQDTALERNISSAAARGLPLTNNNSPNPQQQNQQTKFLKFTLTAGKFWKFNIKPQSFASHKEEELRLHKNLSTNNYIIDDDGWFQYNPQQQQLFAWPDLTVKQGTYHFVLLPSGIDFEADSENSVQPDVVANIVVELIRPTNYGFKSDIDQFTDHKFSLDHLHRSSSYPLLLQQIIAVFDTVTRSTNSGSGSPSSNSSISLAATLLSQAKNLRPSNKLSEYLLISSTYSSDGDLFSLTWTLHPFIIKDTITPITECRLSIINETVSRLANLNAGYTTGDDKFIINYTLEGPHVNSQAIFPTERGNNALKLKLNGPCQREKIIEELLPQYPNRYHNILLTDFYDKENSIVEQQKRSSNILPSSSTITPELKSSDTVISDSILQNRSKQSQPTPTTTTYATRILPIAITTTTEPVTITTTVLPQKTVATTPTPLIKSSSAPAHVETSTEIYSRDELPTSVVNTVRPATLPPSPRPTVKSMEKFIDISENAKEITTTVQPNFLKDRKEYLWTQKQANKPDTPITLHPPKIPPQAKSFEKFFESSDDRFPSPAMNDIVSTTTAVPANNNSTTNVPQKPTSMTRDMTQDSSLNEDFMAIVTDVMDYLVSVAVPLSIILGVTLLISIIIACCNLCAKRRKSKQFQVKDRYSFRYSSERSAFLKNSSKPVILDADQKSISMGGTPQHQSLRSNDKKNTDMTQYLPLHHISHPPQ